MQSFVLVLIVFAAREWREREEEKSEVDSDAAAIRDKNGISEEDKPEETIDKRYLILQDKLKKA